MRDNQSDNKHLPTLLLTTLNTLDTWYQLYEGGVGFYSLHEEDGNVYFALLLPCRYFSNESCDYLYALTDNAGLVILPYVYTRTPDFTDRDTWCWQYITESMFNMFTYVTGFDLRGLDFNDFKHEIKLDAPSKFVSKSERDQFADGLRQLARSVNGNEAFDRLVYSTKINLI